MNLYIVLLSPLPAIKPSLAQTALNSFLCLSLHLSTIRMITQVVLVSVFMADKLCLAKTTSILMNAAIFTITKT